jgi:hypothetical protein
VVLWKLLELYESWSAKIILSQNICCWRFPAEHFVWFRKIRSDISGQNGGAFLRVYVKDKHFWKPPINTITFSWCLLTIYYVATNFINISLHCQFSCWGLFPLHYMHFYCSYTLYLICYQRIRSENLKSQVYLEKSVLMLTHNALLKFYVHTTVLWKNIIYFYVNILCLNEDEVLFLTRSDFKWLSSGLLFRVA